MASETTPLVSWKDVEDIEPMPNGAEAAEFNPRPVLRSRNGAPPPSSAPGGRLHSRHNMKQPSVGGGWVDYVVDSLKPSFAPLPPLGPVGSDYASGGVGTLLIPRKAPVKVEPKVHFANERTFLSWLHVIAMLTAASGLILKYGDNGNIATQLYGLVLLPVSAAFLFYSLWKYLTRMRMIKKHEPGPYIDVVGPVTITTILMATIVTQFVLIVHSLHKKEHKA